MVLDICNKKYINGNYVNQNHITYKLQKQNLKSAWIIFNLLFIVKTFFRVS